MSFSALVVAAAAGAVAAVALMTVSPASTRIGADTYRQLDLFGEVFQRVHTDYVEDVDDSELVEGAINGMLQSLDPHSSFIPADAFDDIRVQTSGEYGGLGIEVTMEDGLVKVISPIDDTPAQRAGIEAGDFITAVNGQPILGMTLDEAITKMKGEPGTTATLTIAREGEERSFDVDITRAVIVIKSVRYRIEDEDVGYIRIATFSEQTEKGLDEALASFKKELGGDLAGVVLDLRDNPGGLVDQAVAVAGAFLDGGEVVSTKGRNPRDNERYSAKRGDAIPDKPIVVLINRGSASASEIVAGALQDRERAILVGAQSFGKGSVQTILPLQGGVNGALRLTTSRYYTPSGVSIQAKGITPDVEVAVNDGRRRISEADLPNALDTDGNGSLHAPTDEEIAAAEAAQADEDRRDLALEKAIEIIRGSEQSARL